MTIVPYDRAKAVAYARQWAFGRNPRFYDFEELGGDCTNFISQVLYAGGGVMNWEEHVGWFYSSPSHRAAAWTGVEFLYRFLMRNQGAGPICRKVSLQEMQPGDVVQLSFDGERYAHSLAVVSTDHPVTESGLLIATHTYDAYNRPLDTYTYEKARYLHILHFNRP